MAAISEFSIEHDKGLTILVCKRPQRGQAEPKIRRQYFNYDELIAAHQLMGEEIDRQRQQRAARRRPVPRPPGRGTG